MNVQDELLTYFMETKHIIYITPSTFIEMVKIYIHLLKIQQNILPLNLRKYSLGLQTLHDTNIQVEKLQKRIKEYQPILQQSKKENEQLLAKLEKSTEVALETEGQVILETKTAQVKKDEVNILKESC